jgi:hypothetical protein
MVLPIFQELSERVWSGEVFLFHSSLPSPSEIRPVSNLIVLTGWKEIQQPRLAVMIQHTGIGRGEARLPHVWRPGAL